MPTPRTEASELAVAFGILGIDPGTRLSDQERERLFEGTLPLSSYETFLAEYRNRYELHSRMLQVGSGLRSAAPHFSSLDSLRWAGPERQASTMSASADLIVSNTPVSVKAISNVVANPSPHNLIVNLPSGQAFSQNEQNWYLVKAHQEFQALYDFVRRSEQSLAHLPATISDFEATASGEDRDNVQEVIGTYSGDQKAEFIDRYLQMCHEVASKSADEFNVRIQRTMAGRSRTAVTENIIRSFFRVDAVAYILCGIDAKQEFALQIPAITDLKTQWALDRIEAIPDLSRRQSVVDFELEFNSRKGQDTHIAAFHAELRWSHGRFCGAPEAKLYKDFHYSELPFFHALI